MPECLIAIHQPNFFPWLGYFDKIRRSDNFILLDDVQFPKTGGAWTNRVKILQAGTARWLTAPIDRTYSGVRPINEMYFVKGDPWRDKAIKSLNAAYAAAPCFKQTMDIVGPLLTNPIDNVADYNIQAIWNLTVALGWSHKTLFRSSAMRIETIATERLVDLVRTVGGTSYLCGGGAEGYQDDHLFEAEGLGLAYQNFTPMPYPQTGAGAFTAGLSIIDALMNVGIPGVTAMLAKCA